MLALLENSSAYEFCSWSLFLALFSSWIFMCYPMKQIKIPQFCLINTHIFSNCEYYTIKTNPFSIVLTGGKCWSPIIMEWSSGKVWDCLGLPVIGFHSWYWLESLFYYFCVCFGIKHIWVWCISSLVSLLTISTAKTPFEIFYCVKFTYTTSHAFKGARTQQILVTFLLKFTQLILLHQHKQFISHELGKKLGIKFWRKSYNAN